MEVFPTLQLKKEYKQILERVEVVRIAMTKTRELLRIQVLSDYMIEKKVIFAVEQEIEKQLFSAANTEVTIYEKFQLSTQYTPQKIMEVYGESILLELKKRSRLEYNVLKKAKISYPTVEEMHLCLEDTVFTKEKKDELIRILEKIIQERCGIPVTITHDYYQPVVRVKEEVEVTIERNDRPLVEEEKSVEPKKPDSIKQKEEQRQDRKPSPNKAEKPKWKKREKITPDHPDVFFGRNFEEEVIKLAEVQDEMGEVVVRGEVIQLEKRELKSGNFLYMFDITDYTDTITIKLFPRDYQLESLQEGLVKGNCIKVKGITMIDKFDKELTIGSVAGMKKIPTFRESRQDTMTQKRVELHCHTKMSDMDGVSSVKDLIKTAKGFGHTALAITDHGVTQAFPEAGHVLSHDDPFKIIYGMEAYLVDDSKQVVTFERGQTFEDTFVVFDVETTGFSARKNQMIEIGAVKVQQGELIDSYQTFLNPQEPIPYNIQMLTGINDAMVMEAPLVEEELSNFLAFCGDSVLVAHNAKFDYGFLEEKARKQGVNVSNTYLDTLSLARTMLPNKSKYTLDSVAKEYKIVNQHHHRAIDDANATAQIFLRMVKELEEEGVHTLAALNEYTSSDANAIRKLPYYHAIILAKNEIGRTNLYTLVSKSHLTYFSGGKTGKPKIPKSLYNQYEEGLIIGSACEAGELYRALLEEQSEETIAEIVGYYDYLEIQPLGNNQFLIESERYKEIQSKEDLEEINRKIVKLGEIFQKPVVATCDVHFLNPEDAVYRAIIMKSKGFKDADNQAPLYLRTTEEMLEEFAYLGEDKAREVVITNTNYIADQIEKIYPVRPDKCPPVIEDSDKTLTNICYEKAHELYGNPLPEVVESRLKKELDSIISNGFAVMYIISQKLVWKSIEDGYLVGSRGSVGSSFVATMSGITEVNPLQPHYYCLACHYTDFESEYVRSFSGRAGCDMESKECPQCGKVLERDGFDIPFETFLGFKGDKEPDIDLNFSGVYQSKAHKYTEVIFGKGQTFRAGTIGTLADKTAYGYVKNYYDEKEEYKRKCEINRMIQGCTGIRRSTGQHPGGIVVLPIGENIYSFTPVQRPANDMHTETITTHFDYHAIDHNLLKLDILGHDDPTMIRMLEELTKTVATTIPLDDPEVMSLFNSTKALQITSDQIGGCKMGSLGIPEFGTEFVIQMLEDTAPTSFSDLIRISGLSHGTDVWLSNAQELIKEGKATISTAICTRDDIMVYLIYMGVESSLAFTIMESVRKGKGLKPEWEEAMLEANVPEWYIWSCKKIKYMFPKAHAAAYVMMAWRIAYYKVNYPLAYYAAFFSIRASAFSYELMCQGQQHLEYKMKEIRRKTEGLSKKDEDSIKDMKIVQEMYARGYEFTPIDLFIAKAYDFQLVDGKIMPSLNSIDGLGEKAAEAVVEAVKDGAFLSKEDFKIRTKVPLKVIELMDQLGIFGDIPESNQMSIMDFLAVE